VLIKEVKKMTKKEIVIKVAETTKVKQLDVRKVVQKTLDEIVAALVRGERVELRNFGIFRVKSRRGRTGRNPRTGETVPVPPKKAVVFKPGLIMKREVK
jgi:nucleoid DNA-binding protein